MEGALAEKKKKGNSFLLYRIFPESCIIVYFPRLFYDFFSLILSLKLRVVLINLTGIFTNLERSVTYFEIISVIFGLCYLFSSF